MDTTARQRRTFANRSMRALLATVRATCVLGMAVPAPLLARTLPDASALMPGFAADAATLGLVAADTVLVESGGVAANGERLILATSSAAAPPSYGATPVFFQRRTSFFIESLAGDTTPIAESELRVGERDGHVSIDAIDRFPESLDGAAGYSTGLAGLEIRRHVEMEFKGFDAMVAAVTGGDAPDAAARPALIAAMLRDGEIEIDKFHHTVTVLYPDGSERLFAGDEFVFDSVLAELGVDALTSGGTIYDCYASIGVELTIFGAACLVAGVVVCAVGCAVSAGILCIPCISGASLVCGLGAAVGSLGFCLAKVLFGVDPPPTATPRPTSTRTPTPTATPTLVGDCDGDGRVSIAELVTGVGIALGYRDFETCRFLDANGDGRITVGELIAAVRNLLG
jgi:hypothetical protein